MRHHFHRCGHLRVLGLEARDRSHARKGGAQILEELCEAKKLAPCVGLADCDILSAGQKRDLLATRATRLREEEGGASPLADMNAPRAGELSELRRLLLDERSEIVEGNRQRAAEAGGAVRRNPRPLTTSEEHELGAAGVSIFLDDDLRSLRTTRLDAIDRALDAMAHKGFGGCARCGKPIDIGRLALAPDTAVCSGCAKEALPEIGPRAV